MKKLFSWNDLQLLRFYLFIQPHPITGHDSFNYTKLLARIVSIHIYDNYHLLYFQPLGLFENYIWPLRTPESLLRRYSPS